MTATITYHQEIGMTQYLRDKVGTYQGLLKELSVNPKAADKALTAQHNAYRIPFMDVRLTQIPSCCGVHVLHGFGDNADSRLSDITDKSLIDLGIYKLYKILEKNNKLITPSYSHTAIGKKYVLAAVNMKQQNVGQLLVDYFGFIRLEDDFMNIGESPNITLLGLRFSKWSPGKNII